MVNSPYRIPVVAGMPYRIGAHHPPTGVDFTVPGIPAPQGSKKGFVVNRRVVMAESSNCAKTASTTSGYSGKRARYSAGSGSTSPFR